jgi:hypothetical protein
MKHSKSTVTWDEPDKAALEYIKNRGYASYSSLKMVRDCIDPTEKKSAVYFDVGTEVHAQFLEKEKQKLKLTKEDSKAVKLMVKALEEHPVVSSLMTSAQVEVKFEQKLGGLSVLGYIDILPPKKAVGDLKTTRHKNLHDFAANMDFLQAALYLKVTKRKDFYYVGIQKVAPFRVFVFNVNQYPERLEKAFKELDYLIKYIKQKLKL